MKCIVCITCVQMEKNILFWDVTPLQIYRRFRGTHCSDLHFDREDGGSTFLRNVGKTKQHHIPEDSILNRRRRVRASSPPWRMVFGNCTEGNVWPYDRGSNGKMDTLPQTILRLSNQSVYEGYGMYFMWDR
jgi:hypothetical protein